MRAEVCGLQREDRGKSVIAPFDHMVADTTRVKRMCMKNTGYKQNYLEKGKKKSDHYLLYWLFSPKQTPLI